MIIEEMISGKTTDDLVNLLTVIEKERNAIENSNDLIDNEISRIDREILVLRTQKKDLEDTVRHGKKLVRDKRLDYKICERQFWKVKENR